MKLRGLKTSIATDFAVLIGTGMLLLNIVILSIWQQFATEAEINNSEEYLKVLAEEVIVSCDDADNVIGNLNSEYEASKPQLFLYNDGEVYPENQPHNPHLFRILQISSRTQKAIREVESTSWSIVGMRIEKLSIARPIGSCQDRSAVGFVKNLNPVYRIIMKKQSYIIAYILVNVIILTTIGFFRMRKLVVAPLEKLVDLSQNFKTEEHSLLEMTSYRSEFSHVASTLHRMLLKIENDKLKLQDTIESLERANAQILAEQSRMVEAEKFAAVGRLSAGLAHEIGNPLGIIQGYIELLERVDLDASERQQYTARAVKELNRVSSLIQQLLNLAVKRSNADSRTPVAPMVRELIEMIQHQKRSKDILFVEECENICEKAHCSEADLHQVLLNCLMNAIDAVEDVKNGEKVIKVSCCIQEDKNKQRCILLIISDNGIGIEKEMLPSVFDPFFTTKKVGHGTGLGLSVSRSIIENNGGSIDLESDKDKGTTVTICLPSESE